MVVSKKKITIIGAEIAKEGLEFVFEGELLECSPCPLKKACHNLVTGRKYRIVNVRPTRHECNVHLNGCYTVEVNEVPVETLITNDRAVQNTRIEYDENCLIYDCPNNNLCNAPGLRDGIKYLVIEVKGKPAHSCEKNLSLRTVLLAPIDFRDSK